MTASCLFDSFSRADTSADLGVSESGQTWANLSPAGAGFHIASDQAAVRSPAFDGARYAVLDHAFADGTFQVVVNTRPSLGTSVGLVLRATDTSNWVGVELYRQGSDDALYLYSLIANSYTMYLGSSGTVVTGITYPCTIQAVLTGSLVRAVLNGAQVGATATIAFHATETKHGILGIIAGGVPPPPLDNYQGCPPVTGGWLTGAHGRFRPRPPRAT